jgi:putative methionine-R-sulfoxide reductase with GAF domain
VFAGSRAAGGGRFSGKSLQQKSIGDLNAANAHFCFVCLLVTLPLVMSAAARVTFSAYLAHVGLPAELGSVPLIARSPVNVLAAMNSPAPQLSAEQLHSMLRYKVPKVAAHGGCSRKKEWEELPFDLGAALGVPSDAVSHPEITRLWRLNSIIESLQVTTNCDWVGVYHVRRPDQAASKSLMKEAYRGEASRALFPLTAEFAEQSNNSFVGLNAKARLIEDINTYSGSYYECDAKVQSELCVPIIDLRNGLSQSVDSPDSVQIAADADRPAVSVRGIIDAESFKAHFFTREVMACVAHTAYELGFVY